MWGYFADMSLQGSRVGERPNYWPPNGSKTRVVYLAPLLEIGTASREGVDAIVADVYKKCVLQDGASVVLVAGDFQNFGHLVRWNKLHPYASWMRPVPGEWHWWAHSLMAINKEWWHTNVSKINGKGEFCDKGVEQKWGSVEKFNRYKFFRET